MPKPKTVEHTRLPAALREARGSICRAAVCKELDVSPSYYIDVEAGRRGLSHVNIFKVAKFLGVDPLPLLYAQAEDRGDVRLPTRLGSRDMVAAELSLVWGELSDSDISAIHAVIRNAA
jgi:transcriptional regulator with XRE-family HTH domain